MGESRSKTSCVDCSSIFAYILHMIRSQCKKTNTSQTSLNQEEFQRNIRNSENPVDPVDRIQEGRTSTNKDNYTKYMNGRNNADIHPGDENMTHCNNINSNSNNSSNNDKNSANYRYNNTVTPNKNKRLRNSRRGRIEANKWVLFTESDEPVLGNDVLNRSQLDLQLGDPHNIDCSRTPSPRKPKLHRLSYSLDDETF